MCRSQFQISSWCNKHAWLFVNFFCSELSVCVLAVCFQAMFIKSQRKNFRDKQKGNNICSTKKGSLGFQMWRLKCPVRIKIYSWFKLEYTICSCKFHQHLYLYLDGDWDKLLIRDNMMQFNKYFWVFCIFQILHWTYKYRWQSTCPLTVHG